MLVVIGVGAVEVKWEYVREGVEAVGLAHEVDECR